MSCAVSRTSFRAAAPSVLRMNWEWNYFGGRHFESGNTVGVHFEPGPDGGVVTLDDTAILDCAKRILDERQAN